MTQEQIALALNEWMRRYIEDPRAFEAEFQAVGEFMAEEIIGQEPSYGQRGAAYTARLLSEL